MGTERSDANVAYATAIALVLDADDTYTTIEPGRQPQPLAEARLEARECECGGAVAVLQGGVGGRLAGAGGAGEFQVALGAGAQGPGAWRRGPRRSGGAGQEGAQRRRPPTPA